MFAKSKRQPHAAVPKTSRDDRPRTWRLPFGRVGRPDGSRDARNRLERTRLRRRSGTKRGMAMRALAMWLMHFGKKVFVVGDVTTPAIARDDLLVVGSGSGSTGSLQVMARRASSVGAKILLLTIVPQSAIGQLADCVVRVPAPSTKAKDAMETVNSVQPMGSLFEQVLLLLGDIIVTKMGPKPSPSGETFRS